ncbi:hypothetical protein [Candidatus Binatus sp.]|jgi:hypothetical protein|uniref:hypothetical protein n=1 Tax=Candidatus Binatus sp. TaxID=2811406 RepID=UPI003BE24587
MAESSKADAGRKVTELLQSFVTDAPLYRQVTIPKKWLPRVLGDGRERVVAYDILPRTVVRVCEVCDSQPTNWEGHGDAFHALKQLGSAAYKCKNCDQNQLTIYFWFTEETDSTVFVKVGVWPQLEIDASPALKKALGEKLALYRRGKTLRHHGYGLGAVAYFRRIVEETTDQLVTLVEQAVKESGLSDEDIKENLEAIARARKAPRFEDKVNLAADALPKRLLVGGTNPLKSLFKLLSDGLHAREDDECIEIVDAIDYLLSYLLVALKEHREQQLKYVEEIQAVQSLIAKRQRK